MFCVAEQKTENDLSSDESNIKSPFKYIWQYILAFEGKKEKTKLLYIIQETWEQKKIGPSFHHNASSL